MMMLKKLKKIISFLLMTACCILHTARAGELTIMPSPSLGQRLVEYVKGIVYNSSYSSYKLGGSYFDAANGVYIVDCSNFVDNLIRDIYPNAYSKLVDRAGTEKPTSRSYYDFFTNLENIRTHYWNPVKRVDELRPGDILVFRPNPALSEESTGHVMVVMSKPSKATNSFLIRVADSSPFRHSQDTRQLHVSGIGIGTMQLKANPKTGQPYAYAWQVGSRWTESMKIAMGRPIEA